MNFPPTDDEIAVKEGWLEFDDYDGALEQKQSERERHCSLILQASTVQTVG